MGRKLVEKILAALHSFGDEFRGAFTSEETAMMKRVFDQVCREKGIQVDNQDHRETLALVILRATKAQTTEVKLLSLAQKAMKNY
jgi:hypothetical protein